MKCASSGRDVCVSIQDDWVHSVKFPCVYEFSAGECENDYEKLVIFVRIKLT
jgi:hypothetical protein